MMQITTFCSQFSATALNQGVDCKKPAMPEQPTEEPKLQDSKLFYFSLLAKEENVTLENNILPAAMTSLPPQKKSPEHYGVYRTWNKFRLHVFIPRV